MLPPAFVALGHGRAQAASNKPVAYMLMTVDTDMGGALPIKPKKFFGPPPVFLHFFKAHNDFLYELRPAEYSFGGLISGMSIGWDLYNQGAFTAEPGTVAYLGWHRFSRTASSEFRWEVSDDLSHSLSSLTDEQRAKIEGLPVKHWVPVPQPGKPR